MAYKVYFWFLLTLLVLTYAQTFSAQVSLYDLMDLPFSMVALTGLFGYVYNRRVGLQRFWVAFFCVQIGWDLFYVSQRTFQLPENGSLAEFNVGLFFSCLLVAPCYIALFRYAFRRTGLWHRPPIDH
jgi:hypothetical protein